MAGHLVAGHLAFSFDTETGFNPELLASGQIQLRKVDGWETLDQSREPAALGAAA